MGYSVRTDLDGVFGKNNVDAWADLDGDQDAAKITTRIANAIVTADDRIDSFMRGGLYSLPLVNKLSETPVIIRDVSAKLAGVWLYESRGVQDLTPEGAPMHRLQWHKKDATSTLRKLAAGQLTLDTLVIKTLSPTVVKVT